MDDWDAKSRMGSTQYAERIYGNSATVDTHAHDDEAEEDIEADIKHEIEDLKVTDRTPLFQPVRLEVQCVLFFKTRAPIEPVSFVHGICSDAMKGTLKNRSRCVRKLTPMTLMGKATEKSLEEVARAVLAAQFHVPGNPPKKPMPAVNVVSAERHVCNDAEVSVACFTLGRCREGRRLVDAAGRGRIAGDGSATQMALTWLGVVQFAIRFSCRNHQTLTRDAVIKQVAEAVGSPHTVDLSKYDVLIIVELYKNMCGMSVVGDDFEALKRYNLAEIHAARRTQPAASRNLS
ncbi:hypothetical protein MMC18_007627 [Xylographa bjoerkii]|nr:hypothetical protein [Xylographa bjoerkii]